MSEQDKSNDSANYNIQANDISGQIAIGSNITQTQGPSQPAKKTTSQAKNKQEVPVEANEIRKILVEYFSDGDLRDICFELEVEYASLPGEGKRDKARELVAECQRTNKLPELIAICIRERPYAFQ